MNEKLKVICIVVFLPFESLAQKRKKRTPDKLRLASRLENDLPSFFRTFFFIIIISLKYTQKHTNRLSSRTVAWFPIGLMDFFLVFFYAAPFFLIFNKPNQEGSISLIAYFACVCFIFVLPTLFFACLYVFFIVYDSTIILLVFSMSVFVWLYVQFVFINLKKYVHPMNLCSNCSLFLFCLLVLLCV